MRGFSGWQAPVLQKVIRQAFMPVEKSSSAVV
jgi:hypothetical protein